jgi:hypothetical protein
MTIPFAAVKCGERCQGYLRKERAEKGRRIQLRNKGKERKKEGNHSKISAYVKRKNNFNLSSLQFTTSNILFFLRTFCLPTNQPKKKLMAEDARTSHL